jgi:S-adenosylmethionine hydrolase
MNAPIVILTDFGTVDPFVGIMKGVITKINPDFPIIDLTHEIPPGDIRRGGIVFWQSRSYFPEGTTFLGVVDPGVGTQRRSILLETQGQRFVGPDNGLFTFILGPTFRAWELTNPTLSLPNPRVTFHGRDIFAPAAAYVAQGIPGSQFGEAVTELTLAQLPQLEIHLPNRINGEILHIDRFGNALTSLGVFSPLPTGKHTLEPWVGKATGSEVRLESASLQLPGGEIIPWAKTFAEVQTGSCAFLLGSSGLLEIVANRQSAAKLLNLTGGETVTLKWMRTEYFRRTI